MEENIITNCGKLPEEFNLSEKIYECEMGQAIYLDSIKEFIKRYLDWLKERKCHCEACAEERMKKLAGDKFK